MSARDEVAEKLGSPYSDSEDSDGDDQKLLGLDYALKRKKKQTRRRWIFLAVNTCILVFNIGLVLMMSVPKTLTRKADVEAITLPRLPHSGRLNPFAALCSFYLNLLTYIQIGSLLQSP